MSPRPVLGYLERRRKWARPARGLKSLAISEAAALPALGCGKGSREYLGPGPSSVGSTALRREDAAHMYLLQLPSLPKEPLNTPTSPFKGVSRPCPYVREDTEPVLCWDSGLCV